MLVKGKLKPVSQRLHCDGFGVMNNEPEGTEYTLNLSTISDAPFPCPSETVVVKAILGTDGTPGGTGLVPFADFNIEPHDTPPPLYTPKVTMPDPATYEVSYKREPDPDSDSIDNQVATATFRGAEAEFRAKDYVAALSLIIKHEDDIDGPSSLEEALEHFISHSSGKSDTVDSETLLG